MGLPDLLRSLDEEAARELDHILAEQQHEAAAILATAEAEAAAIVAETTEAARVEADRSAQLMLAEARAEARIRRDRAVHEELEALLTAAQRQLAAMVGSETGRAATRALLAEALRLLPTADLVRIDPAHRAVAEDVASRGDGTDITTGTAAGLQLVEVPIGLGAVVEDDAGRALDNTAGVRLGNCWPSQRGVFVQAWLDAAAGTDERQAPR